MINYNCLLFEQEQFFDNQTIEELLRERANYYVDKKRQKDFWILIDPNFLKNVSILKKLNKTKLWKNNNNYVCLISSDQEFIRWIKLRIGFFEELENPLLDKSFTSNGVSFSLSPEDSPTSLLSHNSGSLAPNILAKQLKSMVFN